MRWTSATPALRSLQSPERRNPDQGFDPVVEDLSVAPELDDPRFKPGLEFLAIPSNGKELLARIYVAQGRGPHPVAVFLHGLPGNELNLDLAQVLRRAGWNVLVFHYRGSWGTPGDFSIGNSFQDTYAVMEFLARDRLSEVLRCDRDRIALVGHSMGGFLALHAASRDSRVKAVVSMAGFNFGALGKILRKDFRLRASVVEQFRTGIAPLSGTDPEKLVQEIQREADSWDLLRIPRELTETPLLLICGERDTISIPDIHHHQLMNEILALPRKADASEAVLKADHLFSEARIALARILVEWLPAQV